jgi:hypothetical protein
MPAWFLRLAFAIWPPAEASYAARRINRELGTDHERRLVTIQGEIEKALTATSLCDDAVREAGVVTETELRRKDTLESKATSYLLAIGIAIGLVSGIPALFGEGWRFPSLTAQVLSVLHGLSVLHFLDAAYHAVRARQTEAMAVPLVADVLDLASKPDGADVRRLVSALVRARYNEPLIIKKSNHLAVAESMFLRGLVLIALASIGALTIRLLNETGCW